MKSYLITGATGYVGSMLVKYIKGMDETSAITALVRDRTKAEGMLPDGVEIIVADLCDGSAMGNIKCEYDYLIHCASVTKSSEMITHPVEVIQSIVNTTQNILELAKRCRLKSMVYLSSMEVYGKTDCSDGHRVSEDELGDIDLFNVRSCYPLGKRMAENICYSYYKEYGIPVKIARLAQTFGQGILLDDNRVFAQFSRAVKNGTNIVLHTKGSSVGNYCSINDAVAGLMLILECGLDGEAYNVVNEENTMTIRQMADLVADQIANGKIRVVYDIPNDNKYGYAADTNLRLSGEKITALGWCPKDDMIQMYMEALHGIG